VTYAPRRPGGSITVCHGSVRESRAPVASHSQVRSRLRVDDRDQNAPAATEPRRL